MEANQLNPVSLFVPNPEFCPMPLTQLRKKSRCNLSYALAGAGVTKSVPAVAV